ncbi:MAG: SDR family oxidoreductase [Pseudomonadota bacterium]
MDLSAETVIVTGASRGIGAASVRAFADAGAKVAAMARSADALKELADEIGANVLPLPGDIADHAAVNQAVQACKAQFGPATILVNNAGAIDPIAHLATSDPAAWGKVIDINLKGVYYGMHAVLPDMLNSGRGTIITVSSGAAHNPIEAWSHYCSSKAACAMLTRCVDKEYGDQGIRAMGLSPGTVATEMQREIKSSGINPVSRLNWEDHIPPEWPAQALVWMCGPNADAHIGREISLRDESIRAQIGLA